MMSFIQLRRWTCTGFCYTWDVCESIRGTAQSLCSKGV